MQQLEWMPNVVVLVVLVTLGWFFVAALRRARARRRAEFEEKPYVWKVASDEQRADEALAEEAVVAQPAVEVAEAERGEERADAQQPVAHEEPSESDVEPEPVAPTAPDEALVRGLERTHSSLIARLGRLFRGTQGVDAAVLAELEDALLLADIGVGLTSRILDGLRASLRAGRVTTPDAVRKTLKGEVRAALEKAHAGRFELGAGGAKPAVVLFVGVNGVGKTTTIGKVAAALRADGKDVVLAAGDTFRAAAVAQLAIWGERTQCRVIKGAEGADPASVMFTAVEHARSSGADVLLADTAGRLHTKKDLMDELHKVKRALSKAREGAPDETWLVVDATTGQNALQQAREFHAQLGLTGIILTKLDGTAKGGVVVAIADAVGIPVRYVGVGETAEDLRPFSAQQFVDALFAGG